MKTYAEKLKDPRWQKRRLELFDKADWTCKECHTKTETLHAHHGYYERGLEPWEYPDEVMHVVCEGCHKETQRYLNEVYREIGKLDKLGLFVLGQMLLGIRHNYDTTKVLRLLDRVVGSGPERDPKEPANNDLQDFTWIHEAAANAALDHGFNTGRHTNLDYV